MSKIKTNGTFAAMILAIAMIAAGSTFAQCSFTGAITSSDPTHANALATSGVNSSVADVQACPGVFTTTGAIHYDKYDFSNQTGASASYIVDMNANGCATFLMGSSYLGSYDPNNLCNAYLASLGYGNSDSSSYSYTVPNGSNFYVLVEEFDPAALCASYTVTVTPCPSTAASVFSITGRVLTPSGQGLRNARVILTDAAGTQRSTTTSSFGVYSFSDVASGSYTASVSSKRYRFSAQLLSVNSALSNIDFTGLE
ncbi:MAG: carboxypeptidase-like regulatory domain-containing protein [Pyrinomonadaceae bacterium]